MAVDQKADDTKDQAAVIGKTATLELSSAQAEVVVAGQASSTLSLALRSVADNDDEQTVHRSGNASVRILRGGRSEIVKLR
jgi:pilus assembly protein CpaB